MEMGSDYYNTYLQEKLHIILSLKENELLIANDFNLEQSCGSDILTTLLQRSKVQLKDLDMLVNVTEEIAQQIFYFTDQSDDHVFKLECTR